MAKPGDIPTPQPPQEEIKQKKPKGPGFFKGGWEDIKNTVVGVEAAAAHLVTNPVDSAIKGTLIGLSAVPALGSMIAAGYSIKQSIQNTWRDGMTFRKTAQVIGSTLFKAGVAAGIAAIPGGGGPVIMSTMIAQNIGRQVKQDAKAQGISTQTAVAQKYQKAAHNIGKLRHPTQLGQHFKKAFNNFINKGVKNNINEVVGPITQAQQQKRTEKRMAVNGVANTPSPPTRNFKETVEQESKNTLKNIGTGLLTVVPRLATNPIDTLSKVGVVALASSGVPGLAGVVTGAYVAKHFLVNNWKPNMSLGAKTGAIAKTIVVAVGAGLLGSLPVVGGVITGTIATRDIGAQVRQDARAKGISTMSTIGQSWKGAVTTLSKEGIQRSFSEFKDRGVIGNLKEFVGPITRKGKEERLEAKRAVHLNKLASKETGPSIVETSSNSKSMPKSTTIDSSVPTKDQSSSIATKLKEKFKGVKTHFSTKISAPIGAGKGAESSKSTHQQQR